MASPTQEELAISQWQRKREEQKAKMNARVSKTRIALVLGISLLVARKIMNQSYRSIFTKTLGAALFSVCISLRRAPTPTPNARHIYYHWPIIGGVEWLYHTLTECPVQQQIEEGRKANFQSYELNLLGGTRDIYLYERADLEYVLKDNWRNFTKNTDFGLGFLDFFGEILGRGIFAVDWDDGEWQAHRKTASHMFSNTALTSKMEISFNRHGEHLCELLSKKAETGAKFNLQEAMQALTFDSICDIAFGTNPGAMEASLGRNERIDFLVRFDRLQQNLINRFMMPGPMWLFFRKLGLFYEVAVENDAREIRNYVQRIVQSRKSESDPAARGDLLSLYIDAANKSPDKAHLKEDEYLVDMVLNFAIAGRDTTSCTLTNLFLELGKDAESCAKSGKKSAADKMREELASIVGKQRGVTMDDVKALRYCSAVFNEILRLHPPVAIDGRGCREDVVLPTGRIIEKGNFFWIPNSAIGRDPGRYDKPDDFIPERWIEDAPTDEPIRRVDEYSHPVFWGGPRLCIGKDAARLEVLCIAKAFLEEYDFVLALGNDPRTAPAPVQFYEKGLWGKVLCKVH